MSDPRDDLIKKLEQENARLAKTVEELRGSEHRLRAIFATEPECVKTLAADGTLIDINPAGLRIIEADSLDQVKGFSVYSLAQGQHRANFEQLTRDVFRGQSGVLAFEMTGLKGRKRWLETHAAPLRDKDGSVIAEIAVTRDITERKRAQEEQQKLAAIITHTSDFVGIANLDGTGVFINEAGAKILGLQNVAEISSFTIFNCVAPEDHARVRSEILPRLHAGGQWKGELLLRHLKTGQPIPMELTAFAILSHPGGPPAFLAGVGRDIGERRRAEQHIRRLNRVYSVLTGTNEMIMREPDRQRMLNAACIIAVNKGEFLMAWIGMLDPATGEVSPVASAGVVEGYLNHLHLDIHDSQARSGPTARALLSGVHAICRDIEKDLPLAAWRDEALNRGFRSSAAFPLTVNGQTIGVFNLYSSQIGFFDDAEEVHLLNELALDISFALDLNAREAERLRAQQALRAAEERYRELAETIDEVFWITDPKKQRLLYVSPAFERIWGRPSQSLSESPAEWLKSIHPDDRERIAAALPKQADGDYDETYRITRPDGSIRWIRDRAFPVHDASGNIRRIVGTAEDITERRQLEEQFRQSQKMDAMGQLAGGVAHDFNNILAAIMMQADLAGETVAPESRERLHQIRAYSERAANLTRQLLLLSRRQVMEPRDLDLNETVTDLSKMLRRIIGDNIVLQLNLHAAPLITRADAGMLDQVLLNLAVNARDAMPLGGRLVIETCETIVDPETARETPEAPPGRYICLTVSDTGAGIPPEILPRIFEPFFTTKEPGKGTGLGLATVFGVIKQHRGFIKVLSPPHQGATFHVHLPASQSASASHVATQTAHPRPAGGKETILLVEDEAGVRLLTGAILERAGYRVLSAANGLEAMRRWEDHHDTVHLLLTDIMMPEGLSGFDLANTLQSRQPGMRALFTSGYSGEHAGRERILREGQNFLQKPAAVDHLLQTVRRLLDS